MKVYETEKGQCFSGDSKSLLVKKPLNKFKQRVQLLITSPPFPLNRSKSYGNKKGKEYKNWFFEMGKLFADMLSEDGSLVIEIGNAWEPGRPVQSILHLQCLIGLIEECGLNLIQEFICYNPSRLPTPASWVTVNRIRAVDSYTHVWWLSKTDFPKADNRKILRPYSKGMRDLLTRGEYNSGARPSGHRISKKGFLNEGKGSIPHNLIEVEPIDIHRENRTPYCFADSESEFDQNFDKLPVNVLSLSNTQSNDSFSKTCRERGITKHPATMHPGLIALFINFLTDEEDLVMDPFAGSNTTGFVAETLNRNWLAIELAEEYIEQSKIRFEDNRIKTSVWNA